MVVHQAVVHPAANLCIFHQVIETPENDYFVNNQHTQVSNHICDGIVQTCTPKINKHVTEVIISYTFNYYLIKSHQVIICSNLIN